MEKENKKAKRIKYTVQIGEELYNLLKKQRDKVNEATYNCVKASYYEAGEILAKKIISSNLI